ncbi:MAG: aminoacetone oxidase family FAD-binding enzyme [bacterium]
MAKYDVLIIGGGPAGMMSAGIAKNKGLNVLLLEKNTELAKKLMITGGGRCNLTNAEFDVHEFLGKLKNSGKYLFSTFAKFDVKATFDFFEKRNMKIKIEHGKRAFPENDRASSVRYVLMKNMEGVEVRTGISVSGFAKEGNEITGVKLSDGTVVSAKHYILATGGTSHPETGSTGDGYAWLREIGHTVILPKPSLVPVATKELWVKDLQGVTLENVKVTVKIKTKKGASEKIAKENNAKKIVKIGRLLFTHFGVSGPMIINLSKQIGDLLKKGGKGSVEMSLDLFPAFDHGKMNEKLLALFEENKNRLFKNCISEIIPGALAPIVMKMADMHPETFVHSVSRDERILLIKVLKGLKITADHLLGPEKAIVSSGGVSCDEVDFRTMKSKIFPNLSFAGDILNIDRPSGGYSLQICWSTGFVAGDSI